MTSYPLWVNQQPGFVRDVPNPCAEHPVIASVGVVCSSRRAALCQLWVTLRAESGKNLIPACGGEERFRRGQHNLSHNRSALFHSRFSPKSVPISRESLAGSRHEMVRSVRIQLISITETAVTMT